MKQNWRTPYTKYTVNKDNCDEYEGAVSAK